MNLKFSFGEQAPHTHGGDSPVGRPLPFSVAPASNSSELRVEVRVAAATGEEAPALEATLLSGDDVSYGRGIAPVRGSAPDAESRAARSAIARALAEGGEQLLASIITVQLHLPNAAVVAAGLHLATDSAGIWRTTPALEQRTGLPEGTEVRITR
jgi:hypothetical protein